VTRGIPVRLDSFKWPNRQAAKAAFRDILRNSGYDAYDEITEPLHDRMLRELLERHPESEEKTGSGLEHFFVGRTADGGRTYVSKDAVGIWIRRTDGSAVDFGYGAAIEGYSTKSNVKEALRNAVEEGRRAYREGRFAAGPAVSALTGDPILVIEQAYVVYMRPTWAQLTSRFAESEGGWPSIEVDSGHGSAMIGSSLEDPAIEKRWHAFHERYAELGLATANEAASRPRSDESGWKP